MLNLSRKKKVLFSLLHGLALFFLLWYINNTSYSSSIDEGLLKKIFIVEDLILPQKFKPPFNFVFINVSKDISLIKDPKSAGHIAITDRRELRDFFKLLADSNNMHQFVLCDIFFEYPSNSDSALLVEINRTKNIIFPFHLLEDSLQYPVINVPSSLADYETYNGKFSKFKLIYKDTIKTIPVTLHEKLHAVKWQSNFLKLIAFTPRYYIRPFQLKESMEYPYYNLGDLLGLLLKNPALYNDFLKEKFIVMGNFETDAHSTPIGKMYGPLILVDSFLSLENGKNALSWGWILFMVSSLTVTSFILFFVHIKPPKIKSRFWLDFILHNFLNKLFSFLGICSAIVFLSELIFSVQLIISPLFLYLVYVSWAMSWYQDHFKKPQL